MLVAGALITLTPAVTLGWLWFGEPREIYLTPVARSAIWGTLMLIVSLGYMLLLKYPVSIRRLRRATNELAKDRIPAQVELPHGEDDLEVIQHHMETIIHMAEARLSNLEQQHQAEIETERRRVMVESIGAMCHHLSQPATTLNVCMYQLKRMSMPEGGAPLLDLCETSMTEMIKMLDQLRKMAEYNTEPYLDEQDSTARILQLQAMDIVR